jgi:hypothetical protein
MLVCLVAHLTGGVIQSLSIKPSKVAKRYGADQSIDILDRNWVQSMCAFQLVSVDLIALAVVLYFLAFTELLAPRQAIGFAIAGLFFLWGVVWLVQLRALRCKLKDYLLLGHWSVWFLCAGLVSWGSLSL